MGAALITGYRSPVDMRVGRFLSDLTGLLGALFVDHRCIAAVAEFNDGRYIQFWAEGGNSLISEVISNQHPNGPHVLSPDEEQRLIDLGWSEPRSKIGPNWRHEAFDVAGVIECVAMVRSATLEVLGEDRSNTVSLRSWVVIRDGPLTADVALEQVRRAYQASVEEIRRLLESD